MSNFINIAIFMCIMLISIDIGDTLLNRSLKKIKVNNEQISPIFKDAIKVLNKQKTLKNKLAIISKINPGDEPRIMLNLFYNNLVPKLISTKDIHFCFTRKAKGPIAKKIKSFVHIDDRIQVLNAVHKAGVPYKILFIGSHDERKEFKISFKNVFIAKNWKEVGEILVSLE